MHLDEILVLEYITVEKNTEFPSALQKLPDF